jgi:aromatic ring-opening dioxygenase catalytic subunit (LigB family)
MNSILNPAIPAGAYDEFLPGALPRAVAQQAWTPADGPLPALYVSHGAPPLFDDGPWMRQLFDWAQSLPKPKSILIVSAHWEAAPLMLSAPGPDHFIPLFITLGASGDPEHPVQTTIDGYMIGFAKRSFQTIR